MAIINLVHSLNQYWNSEFIIYHTIIVICRCSSIKIHIYIYKTSLIGVINHTDQWSVYNLYWESWWCCISNKWFQQIYLSWITVSIIYGSWIHFASLQMKSLTIKKIDYYKFSEPLRGKILISLFFILFFLSR
jgi:hypothetical protein